MGNFNGHPDCKKFMETVEEIAESQGAKEEEESKEASNAAGLLEKLSVGETQSTKTKEEEKAEQEKKAE